MGHKRTLLCFCDLEAAPILPEVMLHPVVMSRQHPPASTSFSQ